MKKRRREEGTVGDAGTQENRPAEDSSGQGGPGKRPRLDRFALKKHAFLFNRGEERRGFMVTCPVHKELHALAQVLRMLHHFARKFYPDEEPADQGLQKREPNEQGSTLGERENAPSSEESSAKAMRNKLFSVFDSGGVSGLFFVAVNSPRIDVVEFARQIFTDSEFPDQVKTCNACHRLVPIQRVCAANESDIVSIAGVLIPSSFPSAENAQKFAVVMDKRNNDRIDKSTLVPRIASLVPSGHTVDLKMPDLVILIYIFKSACGLSVLPHYNRFAKYNLHAYTATTKSSAQSEEQH